MTTANALRAGLQAVAKRSFSIVTACSNVQSTKLYLVLPVLGLLGYDCSDPFEVYPDHAVGGDGFDTVRCDFAILKDGIPVVAVSAVAAGRDLYEARAPLRRYFDAAPDVKLGILTNGVLFEFFVDASVKDVMDDEPFLTLDLESIARAGVSDDVIEALLPATKDHFTPETIAEAAHIQLVRKRLRAAFVAEAKSPSETFCRFALNRIGVGAVGKEVIDRYYAPMIQTAFEESLIVPAVARLRSQTTKDGHGLMLSMPLGTRLESAAHEIAIVAYIRRRLSYLADDEMLFDAVENVQCRDYIGRLSIFYDRERMGHLFDYFEGADGYDKFVFPEPIGEIVTNNLLEIDSALKTVFAARVKELGGLSPHQKLARIA